MSLMLQETLSIPTVVQRMLDDDRAIVALGEQLAAVLPELIISVARGSSDHAAAYFGYAMMRQVGIPWLSIPLSLVSLQQPPLRLKHCWVAALSQSGKSPDLIASVNYLKQLGARVAAFVNTAESPLAAASDAEVLLPAGLEQSVAATKSYVAMLMAGVQTVAALSARLGQGNGLGVALQDLPGALARAVDEDWSLALEVLHPVDKMVVIGRGPALPIAQEAALKLKETSGIQAEAFSSAEVRHGPMELIGEDYPLLVFAPRGPEQAGLIQLARDMRARGARVLLAAPADVPEATLPLVETAHFALDPIAAILSFYVMADALAAARGRNPDAPRHLAKVTETR